MKVSGSRIVFLVLYVDDILIVGNDILMFTEFNKYLSTCFFMKVLDEAIYK